MVDTKAGRFIGGLDVLRLPLDSLVAWRVSSTHRDEDCDAAQLGYSTKNPPGPRMHTREVSS